MSWKFPSLAALRTFEAAARHMSFTKAAAELNLTQSGVSRQIKLAEDYLGVVLFRRGKQRLELTEAGAVYAKQVHSALVQLQAATFDLRAQHGSGGMLRLAIPPAFGMKWLIPRLEKFNRAHPSIVLDLSTRTKPFDFDAEEIDAAIYYGGKDWPGVVCDRLGGGEVLPVCSPGYLASHPPIKSIHDICDHVLLQHTTRPDKWDEWFRASEIQGGNAWAGPRFEHNYMIMQAATDGLGFALLPRLLVADDLMAKRLVVPFEVQHQTGDPYCLVYPGANSAIPRLRVFRRWLLAESRNTFLPTGLPAN